MISDAAARSPTKTDEDPNVIFTVLTSAVYSRFYGDLRYNGSDTILSESKSSRVTSRRFGVPVTLEDLDSESIKNSMVSDPLYLTKRSELRQYVASLNEHPNCYIPFVSRGRNFSNSGKYDWRYVLRSRVSLNYIDEDIRDSLAFVQAYIEEAKLSAVSPFYTWIKENNLEIRQDQQQSIPDVHSVGCWLCDDHVKHPDFAAYRDVVICNST